MEATSHARLDTLPAEILSLIVNGADIAGRPILDPRCRFYVAQVSRALRACVARPAKVDAARLALHPGATEAWVQGRAASIAMAVERNRNRPLCASSAPEPLVPCDPHRGNAAWLIAKAHCSSAVPWLDDMIETLASTTTNWFPHGDDDDVMCRCHASDDGGSVDALTGRDQVRCNLVALACRMGRPDVAIGLFELCASHCLGMARACLRAAVARDHALVVSSILCRLARQRILCTKGRSPMGALYQYALAMAASGGKIETVRCLTTPYKGRGSDHLAACARAQYMSWSAWKSVNHRGCALAASGFDRGSRLDWELHAAAHNRVDLFACADAESWRFFRPLHAVACAVVHGRDAVATVVARHADPTVDSVGEWAHRIVGLIRDEPAGCADVNAAGLARGLAWLRAHGIRFAFDDIINIACRIDKYPHLVKCLLAAEVDPPRSLRGPRLRHRNFDIIVGHGQWIVLRHVIVTYGRAVDRRVSVGGQSYTPRWWTKIAKRLDIVSTTSGLLLRTRDERAMHMLSLLYRIARLCGCLSATDSNASIRTCQDANNDGDGGDDDEYDAAIDSACWARWCNPVPLSARHVTKVEERSMYKTSDTETRQKASRMLTILAGAGLVSLREPSPVIWRNTTA
ncbi:hypothetical protein psal_cds_781 [Pandoravirus salinus]|uniref:F-box incomplete domain containing protein n=1 Tax=Pandoravirus salinus TaxID=1349410 RepID=S4VVV3_9VIRU|nr:hypothetical protein psal_cds_781 [Pandoravirus salinus]AGO84784.2 hypothetical protein psal_cds_781 [Pandoravirus salinus]